MDKELRDRVGKFLHSIYFSNQGAGFTRDTFWDALPEREKERWREKADQILALVEQDRKEQMIKIAKEVRTAKNLGQYVRLDKDQSLPKRPLYYFGDNAYYQAQQDMWDKGFRKVEEG